MERPRTEDDLRAAFTLAAQDAPSTEHVLAAVRAAPTPRTTRAPRRDRLRRWAPIAAVAAVVVAVAVPVGLAISDDKSGTSSASSGTAYDLNGKPAAPEAAGSSAATSAAAAGGGAVGGPINSPGVASPPTPTGTAEPLCTPAQVSLTLTWKAAGAGLSGVISATNRSSATCDLNVKPAVYPLDQSGARLAVQNAVSAEGRLGPLPVPPGATATSAVTWFSWCGAAPSSKAEIDWGTGVSTVVATGTPSAPSCTPDLPNAISSDWFNRS